MNNRPSRRNTPMRATTLSVLAFYPNIAAESVNRIVLAVTAITFDISQ